MMAMMSSTGANGFPLLGGLQAFGFGVMFASIISGWAGIRALRVLPISTPKLGALLLTPALGVAILAAVIGTLAYLSGSTDLHALDSLTACVLIFGLGAMGVAVMLRFGNYGFLLLIGAMVIITPIVFIVSTWQLPLRLFAGPVGILLAISGYLLVIRCLRSRSEVYQSRRIFGSILWQQQNS